MRGFAFRNLGLKVLSIGIAGLLWLVVAGERVVERALRVPIEFQNVPTGVEIVGDAPESVTVRVRGSSGALGRLAAGDLSTVLDLRSAKPGRRMFHLSAAQVGTPSGIEVLQVSPSTLTLTFETSGVRVVPVRVEVDGAPARGHRLGEVTVEPATVQVVGPESALRKVRQAVTEPVSIAGASGTRRETVTVGIPDPAVRLRAPQVAQVTVTVAPEPVERTIEGVPVVVRDAPKTLAVEVEPPRVAVVMRGAPAAVDALRPEGVAVWVDGTALRSGSTALDVRADPPAGMALVRVEPGQVRVGARRRR
jgi:YbbR domain-containing protein